MRNKQPEQQYRVTRPDGQVYMTTTPLPPAGHADIAPYEASEAYDDDWYENLPTVGAILTMRDELPVDTLEMEDGVMQLSDERLGVPLGHDLLPEECEVVAAKTIQRNRRNNLLARASLNDLFLVFGSDPYNSARQKYRDICSGSARLGELKAYAELKEQLFRQAGNSPHDFDEPDQPIASSHPALGMSGSHAVNINLFGDNVSGSKLAEVLGALNGHPPASAAIESGRRSDRSRPPARRNDDGWPGGPQVQGGGASDGRRGKRGGRGSRNRIRTPQQRQERKRNFLFAGILGTIGLAGVSVYAISHIDALFNGSDSSADVNHTTVSSQRQQEAAAAKAKRAGLFYFAGQKLTALQVGSFHVSQKVPYAVRYGSDGSHPAGWFPNNKPVELKTTDQTANKYVTTIDNDMIVTEDVSGPGVVTIEQKPGSNEVTPTIHLDKIALNITPPTKSFGQARSWITIPKGTQLSPKSPTAKQINQVNTFISPNAASWQAGQVTKLDAASLKVLDTAYMVQQIDQQESKAINGSATVDGLAVTPVKQDVTDQFKSYKVVQKNDKLTMEPIKVTGHLPALMSSYLAQQGLRMYPGADGFQLSQSGTLVGMRVNQPFTAATVTQNK